MRYYAKVFAGDRYEEAELGDDVKSVGVELSNGVRIELQEDPNMPDRVNVRTNNGTLLIQLSGSAANVVSVRAVPEHSVLKAQRMKSGR